MDSTEAVGRPVVLCVDDDVRVLAALRRAFSREPYELLVTPAPGQAMEWIDERPVDLVIADQRMPEMSGTELLSAVRARSPETSRLLLTGYPATEAMVKQGERMLRKPWNDDQLRRTVRGVLSGKITRRGLTLHVPPCLFREPVVKLDCSRRSNAVLLQLLEDAFGKFPGSDLAILFEHVVLMEESIQEFLELLEPAAVAHGAALVLLDPSGTVSRTLSSSPCPHLRDVRAATGGPSLRILAVHRDVACTTFLRTLLTHLGHDAAKARDEAEAVRLLAAARFDTVVAGPELPESFLASLPPRIALLQLPPGGSILDFVAALRSANDEP